MNYQIPENVAMAIAAMKEKGIDSWVIGGAVRDTLLGRPVHDWDLTVASTPEAVLSALPSAKPIGGVFGTVSWHGIEITPCRAESDYTDHRHPDKIVFGTSLTVDLSRRDFTVNAMAWDGQTLVDPYGGQADLQAKRLCAVGEPEQRFAEDALRILRLYRFAGTLGFSVEEATGNAALARAETLCVVSAPRVRGEVEKALKGAHPSALAPLLATGGLHTFGIDSAVKENFAVLDAVPEGLLYRWWALLHLSASNAFKAGKVFDFGRNFMRDFATMDAFFADGMPADCHALKQMLCKGLPFSFADAAQTFALVDAERFAGLPALYATLCESGEPYLKEHLKITPSELLAMGFKGRALGEVQRCLLKTVVDSPEMNEQTLLISIAQSLKTMV